MGSHSTSRDFLAAAGFLTVKPGTTEGPAVIWDCREAVHKLWCSTGLEEEEIQLRKFLFSPAGVRPAACSGELRKVHINNEFSRNDGVFVHLMKAQLRAVDFICEITF